MAITEWIAIGISLLALAVSGVTAWLTLLRRGVLKMTQPTVIFFGPDGGRGGSDGVQPQLKVFLRTLLYSTARKGQILESMHIGVERGESKQNFSIWVYGDSQLARGSGLFVGPEGISCNHHFLLPDDGTNFRLLPGQYTIRVFAKRVSDRQPRQLAELSLSISEAQAQELDKEDTGIYFDWGPDQQTYHSHIEVRKVQPLPHWLREKAAV